MSRGGQKIEHNSLTRAASKHWYGSCIETENCLIVSYVSVNVCISSLSLL